jgi:hypothetical protein
MNIWECEYTDTFGGEANYLWVRRAEVEIPDGASDLAIVRRCKAAPGLSGARGQTSPMGEGFGFRPYGRCTVAFFTPRY